MTGLSGDYYQGNLDTSAYSNANLPTDIQESIYTRIFDPANQSYDGTDTIRPSASQVLFNAKGEYATELGQPILAKPQAEGEPKLNTYNASSLAYVTPYNPVQQQEINEKYAQTLDSNIENYIVGQKLTSDQATNLQAAINSGEVPPELEDAVTMVKGLSATEVRQQYGLSLMWSPGTTEPDAWQPIESNRTGIITPKMYNYAQFNMIMKGIHSLLTDMESTVQSLMATDSTSTDKSTATTTSTTTDTTGTTDSGTVTTYSDFLKSVGDQLQKMQETLQSLQLQDAQKQEDDTKAKFSAVQDRHDRFSDLLDKRAEAEKKQQKANKVNDIMKIAGPVLAAVAAIAGVIITVVTFGVGSPIGIALVMVAITLGTASVAYSVADSQMGLTSKAVDWFNKTINSWMPDDAPAWEKSLVKALVITGVVIAGAALLIALILAGGEGAAASATTEVATNVATQTATQAAKTMAIEMTKQLTIQLLMMAVMSTNVYPQLMSDILKKCGASKKSQFIGKICMMAFTALALVVAVSAGSGAGSQAATGVKSSAASAQSAATSVTSTVNRWANQGIKATAEDMANTVMDEIQNLIKQIRNLIKSLKNLPQSAVQSATKTVDDFSTAVKQPMFWIGLFKLAPAVGNTTAGIVQGTILMEVAKVIRQVGALEASDQLLKMQIDLLNTQIDQFNDSISNRQDMIKDAHDLFITLYDTASQSLNRMTYAGTLMG